jgi:hypothetical protein
MYSVPEAATLLLGAGVSFPVGDTGDKLIAFQKALISTQIHLEDSFRAVAESTGTFSLGSWVGFVFLLSLLLG